MSKDRDFKRVVRARMQKTGESYTAARAVLLRRGSQVEKEPAASARDFAEVAGVKEATVVARTGRGWAEWKRVLDAVDAHTWPHRDIARHVATVHGLSGWWSQTVTGGYERLSGLRDKGQRRDGRYEVNKSRTFPVAVELLYAAFANARRRAKWLEAGKITLRKAVAGKSVRMTWPDGTSVECWFSAKGAGRSVVAIQHGGLPDKPAAASVRQFWTLHLSLLAAMLGEKR